jgi:hypothetical protein
MPIKDCLILVGLGLGFIILGLVGVIWGRHEERSYFESLATQRDLREFVSHWPERPQLGAWMIGGWVAIALGLVLLVVGIIFLWLAAWPLS